MTKLILARHGETAWNVKRVFRGKADIALDEVGIKQAELLGKYLSSFKLQAIYSSPLRRAADTASIIARYQRLSVQIADGLTDFDYGKWQSLTEQEVKRQYPTLYHEWLTNPHTVRMPEGESLDDVRRRALAVVEEVIAKHQGEVLLVSHRVVHKVLICCLLGLDNSRFWNIKLDVAAITIFEYAGGRFILARHNDTSHLRELRQSSLGDF